MSEHKSDLAAEGQEWKSNAEHVEVLNTPTDESSSSNADSEQYHFTWGKFAACLGLALGFLSDTFLIFSTATVLSYINADLGPSTSYVWIATGDLVASAASGVLIGRLSDIFGRRILFLVGGVLALVGTLVSALGQNIPTMIAGGVIIGLAAAARQNAFAAIGEIVPKKSRGMAFGILENFVSLGVAFGPPISYSCIKHSSWRTIFWIAFAIDVVVLVIVFLFYHPMNQYIHEEGKSGWYQVKHLDWVGLFLFSAGITVFLMGISFGGNNYPWTSAGTLAPIIIGALSVVACGFWEAFASPRYPLFPSVILKNFRGFTVMQIGVFFVGMVFYSTAVLWPEQIQALFTTELTKVGWYSAATGLGPLCFGWLFGVAASKLPHVKWQMVATMCALTAFSGAQACVSVDSHVASTALVALLFISVSGMATYSINMSQLGVAHEYIGLATGVTITMRLLGGAVAQIIYVSILKNTLTSQVANVAAPALAKAGLAPTSIPATIEALLTGNYKSPAVTGLSPKILGVAVASLRQAYVVSFRTVYLSSIAFGGAGIIVLCFAANVDHLRTSKVEIELVEGAHMQAKTDTGEGHIVRADDAGHLHA
ncbi:hypothetical protein KCU85_g8740, partial [Aureobasidium melanogenum]